MPSNSSFPKVADQILGFNKNLIETLSKLHDLTTTEQSTSNVQVFDDEGILKSYSLPSFKTLKADIDRLNNNINSLYSIDSDGAMIQTSNSNKFKKIITVDLNREPNNISSLGEVTKFKTKGNWFFDELIDPNMMIELDLSDKIDNNVSKCLIRRYVVNFERSNDGLTRNGVSALNSFNEKFRSNNNILLEEYLEWISTTSGVVDPNNPRYKENVYDLEPNDLLYDGEFSVLQIEEDRLNRKLWYHLNTIEYLDKSTDNINNLSIGSEIIVNSEKSSTRYKILEVSTELRNPRIRVERVEGIEPIPTGIKTLKIYSPVIYKKTLNVNISYNERSVVFIKPINENNIISKKWSMGVGMFTNDLRVESSNSTNGLTMEQFYTDYVYDYGDVLKDLVIKKIPNRLGAIPPPPILPQENFKVVQVNKHLTDTIDSSSIKKKHNQQTSLKSEIRQIEEAISDRKKKSKITNISSGANKKQTELELKKLIDKRESRSKLLSNVTQEILDISKNPISKAQPKFRVRGFWDIPSPIKANGTKEHEIIHFQIQYRYVSQDGIETSIEQFKMNDSKRASFSNWNEMETKVRNRVYNNDSGEYIWIDEDSENPNINNINQINIPIQNGERVEFRIKSISEVGFPESPIKSDWSEIISVDFPDDLDGVLNENDSILEQASKEDVRLTLNNELESKGLNQHLDDSVSSDDKTYYHQAMNILSGFSDGEGNVLDLFEYLQRLENKVKSLEEKINRSKGLLEVTILRNNEEYKVNNGSETTFNIECENYLDDYEDSNTSIGRIYENNIYVVRDFVVRVRNLAESTPLGLVSSKNYLQESVIYNSSAPQVFWVNEQDEILRSDVSSETRTQLNNQFMWMVNYDSVTDETVSRLSENIGNSFDEDGTNSITKVLGSAEYNIGYNETNILRFIGNNNSLLDPDKWIDDTSSVDSTTKLLTTIHPVVKDLETIVEKNSEKVKNIKSGDENDIIIPINIYFKMNSLDSNQSGVNYEYINLNKQLKTVKHVKKVKFLLENEAENRPFEFTLKFNINRNNAIVKKSIKQINNLIK